MLPDHLVSVTGPTFSGRLGRIIGLESQRGLNMAIPLQVVVLLMVLVTPLTAAGQPGERWSPPRTAWGDPDLQGQWNSQTSTPLERPHDGPLAGRDSLSNQEAETIETANRASCDLPPREGSVGNYNAFWRDIGKPLMRTSLIIDPPNGTIQHITEEGLARLDAERAARRTRGHAD